VDGPGPWAPATAHFRLDADGSGRALEVEAWYPAPASRASEAEEGFPVEAFETGERRAQLAAWVAQAPEACTPRRAHSVRDAEPASHDRPFPVLLMSHCTGGFRFAMHSVAERLASHGFVVLAPDHLGNTHFDDSAKLDDAFLAVRAADISRVLDAALVDGAPALPAALRGRLDGTRVAIVGHSFGAVTAGKVLELDARVRAGLLFAAPVDSPVLNSGGLSRIHRSLSWVLAREDGSISSTGNQFIRENVAAAPRPTWLVELEDAGHWSFTDIAGMGGAFLPGCGSGVRDPGGAPFTYLSNDVARAAAQRYAVAWARAMLLNEADAVAQMEKAVPGDVVRVWKR